MSSIEPISPELQSRIAHLRMRSLEGTITLEEMTEALKAVRGGRVTAQAAAAKSAGVGKSKAPPRSADDLFKELGL